MSVNSIKKITGLVRLTGDKFIVIDEGEPAFVVLPFTEYESMIKERNDQQVVQYITKFPSRSEANSQPNNEESNILERVNQDIEAYRAKQEELQSEEGKTSDKEEKNTSGKAHNFSDTGKY